MTDTTDIFISYKREQRPVVAAIAKVLGAAGYDVYYDIELAYGEDFRDALDRNLKAARLVVVLWTADAVGSEWVRKEARYANKKNKYHPVVVGDVDLPFDLDGEHSVVVPQMLEPAAIAQAVLQSVKATIEPSVKQAASLDTIMDEIIGSDWREWGDDDDATDTAAEETPPPPVTSEGKAEGFKTPAFGSLFGKLGPHFKPMTAEDARIHGQVEALGYNTLSALGEDELDLEGKQIYNLDFLSKFMNLKRLSLKGLKVMTPGTLDRLIHLEDLNIDETFLIDLRPLKGMKNLKTLSARASLLSDISPLQHNTALEKLFLEESLVKDLSPLKGLEKLRCIQLVDGSFIGSPLLGSGAFSHMIVKNYLSSLG